MENDREVSGESWEKDKKIANYKLQIVNIAKGTMDQRVACFNQKNWFYAMTHVGQNSAPESRSNFSFQISTKLLAGNVDQSLATKSWPNFSLKSLTKFQLQYRDQNSGLKSLPNLIIKISTKLLSTGSSGSPSATHQEVLSWHLKRQKSHLSSLLNSSQLVSEWMNDKGRQWSDFGLIKGSRNG